MTDAPDWIATEATITACRYQSPGLSTLAFGFQTTKKFRITFDYYAHGRLYSGEFQSPSPSRRTSASRSPITRSTRNRTAVPSSLAPPQRDHR
jgi:hypothetical protein